MRKDWHWCPTMCTLQVSPEEVTDQIKDTLEDYIERSTEADFMEDDTMYDWLPIDEVDENVGKIASHGTKDGRKPQGRTPGGSAYLLRLDSRWSTRESETAVPGRAQILQQNDVYQPSNACNEYRDFALSAA